MGDFIRRLLIAAIMLLFVSLLFLGGKASEAQSPSLSERTKGWTWPSEGMISDTFNTRNGDHKGIDIAGDLGASVYAVDKGLVVKSYYSQSYGNVIFIKHENGLETVYAHLNERLVVENQNVEMGDMIGKMGNTGRSSGVHLHFEIHENEWTVTKENAINPILALGDADVGQTVEAAAKPARQEAAQAKRKQAQKDMTTKVENEKKSEAEEKEKEIEKAKSETLEITVEEPVEYDPELGQVPYKKAIYYIKENEISKILGELPALQAPKSITIQQFNEVQQKKERSIRAPFTTYYE
ncbi:M23 family metallopeptidase [Niallia circulans]|uniref:M23 family metallopeptidase n=1 Tax=Niallia circulans TaxID=1397 RepID=A0A553SL40_NIACI|nr:M23 family metallopeptidase [Niallia circulans]TRZ37702.1 M23 family metallopeptidase [Niallia circulans]